MQAGCGVPNAACSRMFDILNQQAMRLDRLVQDVLNVARIEAEEVVLHREPISVLPVVKQVVEQTRARSVDRPIHLPLKPGLPLVFADRDFVAEILANLLDNADKYSAPGNVVSIDVRADQTEVVLSVRDSGPGIPDEALGRIFDKFYRADGGDSQSSYGYGLGLYVCRSLVKAQGGHIWAENHPDGGAVFSFTLPVWQGEDGETDDLAD
jgi:K+-sensing histidine kinase KdpD